MASKTLGKWLDSAKLKSGRLSPGGGLLGQLTQVARLISIRDKTHNERDVFYVRADGSWDTHQSEKESMYKTLAPSMNGALTSFVAEMKAQGMWDNVAIATFSDFGRTMTSNGLGTDHAWGGNYAVMGGKVRGGQMLGDYPTDITQDSPLNLGRGRLIPTTPWDGVWHGLAEWMGVEPAKMLDVIPNAVNFQAGKTLITAKQLFE